MVMTSTPSVAFFTCCCFVGFVFTLHVCFYICYIHVSVELATLLVTADTTSLQIFDMCSSVNGDLKFPGGAHRSAAQASDCPAGRLVFG